jgi:hypothetical protein
MTRVAGVNRNKSIPSADNSTLITLLFGPSARQLVSLRCPDQTLHPAGALPHTNGTEV